MRIDPNPCFVLHSRPYRETSLMVEIFSLRQGRLTLVARGAKRRKQNTQALLQPYQKILVGWYGRGEIGTLTKIESCGLPYTLHGRRLISGFYINELILRLLHRHESHAELFHAYETALNSLSSGDNEQIVLRIFEKKILASVGFGLVLDHDINSRLPVSREALYYYQIQSGPTLRTDSKENVETIPVHGFTLLSLKDEVFDNLIALSEARKLMRCIVSRVIGSRPLVSRDLYRSYIKFQ